MKTLLSQFCEEFEAAVRPLLAPLKDFVETLVAGSETHLGAGVSREVLPGFQDVSHQLRVLADKVAEQQAYVLIFGPLKSGKSTLMNAIGAAYVSEVTALPAYPCMVYVSHSDTREFVVTRYNGDEQSFAAPASMRMQVNRDHAELADRIRAEENRGTDFDPALHFPDAIRRIDVRVPAAALAESGAVLVDTPGLYSRMKFGYDQMTREFRDTAACAIFVVKTDNLFLEQVFAEFQSLLSLFSRIFLVVNVDTNKMDLRPDGSLAPSLEREDPVRVIEAFETLSMSAQLKQAVEEQRLKIYPVDLLRAASSRLQHELAGENSGPADEYAGRADFEAFLGDLTDYLNSTDYLVAFLGDSLRHGSNLIGRARELSGHEVVADVARRVTALAGERDDLQDTLAALDRLTRFDWKDAFSDLPAHLASHADGEGAGLWKRSLRAVSNAIDGWFEGDKSVAALMREDLGEVVGAFQTNFATLAEGGLKERAHNSTAGALIDERAARDLDTVGMRLGDFASSGLVAVLPATHARGLEIELDLEQLPVRRSLLDWILFRRVASVRQRLIGPLAKPDRSISRGDKARRLGEAGREWLHVAIHGRVDGAYNEVSKRVAADMASEYSNAVIAAVVAQIEANRASTAERLDRVQTQLGELEALADRLQTLRSRLDDASGAMEQLEERYDEADPAALTLELDEAQVADEMAAVELSTIELEPVPRIMPEAPAEASAEIELEAESAHSSDRHPDGSNADQR
ncbi:GTPase domain-containing protein [Engelhardtia mirabilis]|uniref:Dynamin family protein n=1 Tax=Engelhardtia mirabilis TaxID=2528011 RepID=A0A518BFU7_9BACT|nr:Dynamin family protein [Planctomycetes bacterium Pla133]QDV00180.1 Dynamin family protein [Planctomycetes bacterium Pla86]